jgi:hypothetical protein
MTMDTELVRSWEVLARNGAGRAALRSGARKITKTGLLICVLCGLVYESVAQTHKPDPALVGVYMDRDTARVSLRLEKSGRYNYNEQKEGTWGAENNTLYFTANGSTRACSYTIQPVTDKKLLRLNCQDGSEFDRVWLSQAH